MPDRSMPLVAQTRRLDVSADLLAHAGDFGNLLMRGGEGIATRGTVLQVTGTGQQLIEATNEMLSTILIDDEVGLPGTGPVAFGTLPFDPEEPATMSLPQVVVGRTAGGVSWVTTIWHQGNAFHDSYRAHATTGGPTADPPAATHFEIEPEIDPAEWCAAVTKATEKIRSGALTKVVLSRHVVVSTNQVISASNVLRQLHASYPGCYIYAANEDFLGASPELLVSRIGDVVRAQPMAGSAPRSTDPTTDQRLAAGLLAATKTREEHQITIDMVHETLLPWCSYLDYEAEPSVVPMANVQHLATLVEGRLSQPSPSVLELVLALHPTPAVGGWPRDEALALIRELEPASRDRYAGAIGWVDHKGQGTWAVAIRCAKLQGSRARLSAGNGIVADSDPDDELAETRAKLQALLTALVRP